MSKSVRVLRFLIKRSVPAATVRAVISYASVLIVADAVGLISPYLGAWLTIILTLLNALSLVRLGDDRWMTVKRQTLPILATLLMAILLNQTLDALFSALYVMVIFSRAVGIY